MLYPGLTSWAKFSRPCGTKFVMLGMTRERAAFPVRIGCTDPRSQKRDLGHPSIVTDADVWAVQNTCKQARNAQKNNCVYGHCNFRRIYVSRRSLLRPIYGGYTLWHRGHQLRA